ncbi:MAG: hypothetical protein A2Y84_00465 [Candidatus Colwellbacteria bacterium RBG_13_48_8]|uniref:Cob(I)yrinic acid a,c-diamide adenosyltransferase n=1 Tax=Candidatus Colwellbacteria bacterium RBG_13_48_8 TaxID=1797685 RepID=A0A1G1YV32_9BACT|nr:MAG: hypothetical protein A2Y84_00465 [Candidatus Colwellbacteria bacterium RBG_13_48_8]
MLVVFTGNGKGKTTAAFGHAVRAVGQGKKALMIQFIKGPWRAGEDSAEIKGRGGRFMLKKMGLGFVFILGDKIPFAKHKAAAQKALNYFQKELPKWDMIILDEINVAVSLKLLTASQVLKAVQKAKPGQHIILTGRYAPKSFIRAADLVTEMSDVKHPYHKGKLAEKVIDF